MKRVQNYVTKFYFYDCCKTIKVKLFLDWASESAGI